MPVISMKVISMKVDNTTLDEAIKRIITGVDASQRKVCSTSADKSHPSIDRDLQLYVLRLLRGKLPAHL